MSLLDALRGLNLGFTVRACPECGAEMEHDYVRAPRLQSHWRGVEADVCPDCGYYEYAKQVYAPD